MKLILLLLALILAFALIVGGCVDVDEGSKTYCGLCTVGEYCTSNCNDNVYLQGDCSKGEVCKQATDSNYYCFELTPNGSIDGICP